MLHQNDAVGRLVAFVSRIGARPPTDETKLTLEDEDGTIDNRYEEPLLLRQGIARCLQRSVHLGRQVSTVRGLDRHRSIVLPIHDEQLVRRPAIGENRRRIRSRWTSRSARK